MPFRAKSTANKTYKLVKTRSTSHQFKLQKSFPKQIKEKNNIKTFTSSHFPPVQEEKISKKVKEKERVNEIPRYHQNLKNSESSKDIFGDRNLKKVKIRLKVRGEKVTYYDFVDKNENFLTSQILSEKVPKKMKFKSKRENVKTCPKEPNPASLKFPKCVKKILKKEKKMKKKSEVLKPGGGKKSLRDDVKRKKKNKRKEIALSMINEMTSQE